jgi:hypothetical protein
MALNQVLVQNTGEINGAGGNGDFATPDEVPAGTIAFFPASGGSSIDISSTQLENQGEILIVRGTPDGHRITNILDAEDLRVDSLAYQAPSAQVTEVDVGTVSEDTFLSVKITNLEQGYEPYDRRTFEIEALSGDTEVDIITKFADAFLSRPDAIMGEEGSTVLAAGNASVTFTPSAGANSGAGEITIDGTTYNITWDTDATTTVDNFISANGDTILSRHGIRLSNDSGDLVLTFVNNALTVGDVSHDDDSGSLSAGIDLAQSDTAATSLRLEAKENGEIFDVAAIGFEPSITAVTDPVEGSGTGEQVREMESRVTAVTTGRYNVEDPVLGSIDDVDLFADEANTYDLVILRQETDYNRAINKSARWQDVVLALETGLDKTHINSFLSNHGVSL